MLSRRELIGLGAVAGIAAGCAPLASRLHGRAPKEAFALPDGPTGPAVRLFGRAGFGHRPGDLQAYARDGHEATVERLLRADEGESLFLRAQGAHADVFRENAEELHDLPKEMVVRELQRVAVIRAVHGTNPLLERMSDFWTDHLNVYGKKELASWRLGGYVENVVRGHALGNFREMIRASARSAAMLGYLDGALNRKGAPNENYARELMELHTLGVDGGYTQADVHEVARCFTGWTLEDRFLHPRGRFRFDADLHDDRPKTVLGRPILAHGEDEGDAVIDLLTDHPATARRLAHKLCAYFLGRGSASVEEEVAAQYRATKGDVRAMLRPILLSGEMREGDPVLKRPLDLVASSLRALDGTTDGGGPLLDRLRDMGHAPYEWPMPDGYPVKTSSWSGSMLPRWTFAFALAKGEIRGSELGSRDLPALLGRHPSAELAEAVAKGGLGVAIASPEFQWK